MPYVYSRDIILCSELNLLGKGEGSMERGANVVRICAERVLRNEQEERKCK